MSQSEHLRKSPAELHQAVAGPVESLWGTDDFGLTCLGGDASTRVYHRVHSTQAPARSLIIMELGPDPLRSDEVTDGATVRELPFYELQRFLAGGAIPVPEVHAYLRDEGLLLLEDLGDLTLEAEVSDAGQEARWALYAQAVELLAEMQRYATTTGGDCVCFDRCFDYGLFRWELDHFREWLLEAQRGVVLAGAERHALDQQFDYIARALADLPTTWVHRDYQSRNLMLQPAGTVPRMRVIDFQDALVGPVVYDLVALLRDSYVDLGTSLVERLLDHYHACAHPDFTRERLGQMFWLQTVQRKLKDAGRFVYIERVRQNSSFLRHIPLSLRYVRDALTRLPELQALAELLGRHVPELL